MANAAYLTKLIRPQRHVADPDVGNQTRTASLVQSQLLAVLICEAGGPSNY